MNSFDIFKTADCYDFFNCSIELRDPNDLDSATFLHEYCHHIHNITTVLGSERFNFFVQSFSHLASFFDNAESLKLPIKTWETMGLPEGLRGKYKELTEHLKLWNYLDRSESPRPLKIEEDIGKHVIVFLKEKGNLVDSYPYYLRREEGKYFGRPVGGWFCKESGAFSLEYLHSENWHDPARLLNNKNTVQYHLVPYLMTKFFKDPELVYLAGFLFSDLAMTLATPALGFHLAYLEMLNLEKAKTSADIIEWYQATVEKHMDVIENSLAASISLQKKILVDIEGDDHFIVKVLRKHTQLMIRGLTYRLNNPAFTLNLLPEKLWPGDLKGLLEDFTPLVLSPAEVKSELPTDYLVLDRVMKFFVGCFSDPIGFSQEGGNMFARSDYQSLGDHKFKLTPEFQGDDLDLNREIARLLSMIGKPIELIS